MFKLLLLLLLTVVIGMQTQSNWFYDMDDDWEVSNRLTSVNPYHGWYKQAAKQMDMYGYAKHVGKINRGQYFNPELNMPANRAFGYQSDFNPQDLNSGAVKYKPQGQKFRAKAVHVYEGLASYVGEVRTMPIGQYVQEDGTILVQTNYKGDPCLPNPCTNVMVMSACTAVNKFTAKCSSTLAPVTVMRLTGTPESYWSVGNGAVDAIDITSSSNILMRGISLFGSLSGADTRNGKIQLKETASKKIIISENFQFASNGNYFDHIFSSPGNVKAGVKYTVTVEYYDTENIHYAEGGLASVTAVCNGKTVNIDFFDSSDDSNGSSVTYGGQIPRILISC